MKLLFHEVQDKRSHFQNLLKGYVSGDYIYDYPPRQAFRYFENDVDDIISSSLESSEELNLYFHFPFCKQICAYCNLFTISEISESKFGLYFECLKKELLFYAERIREKRVNTIYLGGGTPSWIPACYFNDLFKFLTDVFDLDIWDIQEVSIEMSPDTAGFQRLNEYRDIGINRVNIGVQALNDNELHCIGRNFASKEILNTLDRVMKSGFKNVCVDLIYGLEGQTMKSWEQSLKSVASFQPQTICPYPLTLRPETGFHSHGYRDVDGMLQYEKYNYARDFLTSRGYEQETHVRYKLLNSDGGYIQKKNHWNQQNILGIGAGARSYLQSISYRNGYSIINRSEAYDMYIRNISKHSRGIIDGYILNHNEMMRKCIVLGLNSLHVPTFINKFSINPLEFFHEEFETLLDSQLILKADNYLQLTRNGITYRDIIAQLFFSDEVNELISRYNYDE